MQPTPFQSNIIDLLDKGATIQRRGRTSRYTVIRPGGGSFTVTARTINSMVAKDFVVTHTRNNVTYITLKQAAQPVTEPGVYSHTVNAGPPIGDIKFKHIVNSIVCQYIDKDDSQTLRESMVNEITRALIGELKGVVNYNELDIQFLIDIQGTRVSLRPLNLQTFILFSCKDEVPPLSVIYGKKEHPGRSFVYRHDEHGFAAMPNEATIIKTT